MATEPYSLLATKFWSKVVFGPADDDCWTWSGNRFPNGYGYLQGKGAAWMAHRLGYSLQVGPIPDNLNVLHRCDNRACVRGDHLFLGTQADNIADMIKKGRAFHQTNPDLLKLLSSHPASPLADRLWARVNRTENCWIWQGSLDGKGYGMIGSGGSKGKILRAHRASWMVTYGDIPEGKVVMQSCLNRACVRPDHLILGTPSDQVQRTADIGHHGSVSHPEQIARGEKLPQSKLTADLVLQMRSDYVNGNSMNYLAGIYGVSPATVRRVILRESWKHI